MCMPQSLSRPHPNREHIAHMPRTFYLLRNFLIISPKFHYIFFIFFKLCIFLCTSVCF